MKTSFGHSSKERLLTCSPNIQRVAYRALVLANNLNMDFSIICGHRPIETQLELYAKNLTKVKKGKHNLMPSSALDFCPFNETWGVVTGAPEQIKRMAKFYYESDSKEALAQINLRLAMDYAVIAACFKLAGEDCGIPIRSGCDWDSDGTSLDNKFNDLGHVEELNVIV